MTVSPRSAAGARPTSLRLTDLVAHAATLGVSVHMGHLPHKVLGVYEPVHARVWISLGLTPDEQRSVLAHELGHAHHGHECGSDRAERAADRYAADLLVDAESYAELERIGLDEHVIADELNVTVDIVHAYREHHLQRLGDITYPRRTRGRFTNALARSLATSTGAP